MSNSAGGDRQEMVEQLEERKEEIAEKAERRDGEREAFFSGIKVGYQSAIEVLRGEEDE